MSDELIGEILEIANDDADALLEMTISVARPDLYEDAIDAFGGWDAALVAVLQKALSSGARKRTRTAASRDDLDVIRSVEALASAPVYTTTTRGHFFWVAPDELEITDEPEKLDTPPDAGPMQRFQVVGEPDGVFLFSSTGTFYGLDPRMLPQWMGESELRRMNNILPLEGGETICNVLPRKAGWEGRVVHITRSGKGKASDSSEYGRTLDREGSTAFLLNDEDAPVAVLHEHGHTLVFCASAKGQGIHFDAAEDMRSMGRKAVGVNVMKLDGDDDEIVNAFHTDEVEQLAVVTQTGLGKRIWFEDFRPQGRGGQGMQVCKLDTGDLVAGVVPCTPADDLAITTSHGRVHRLEAGHFELMGRPAKGNRVIELDDGESVIGLSWLPCSTED